MATLADALALFLTAQGLDRADLVGTSLGGRLVLEMARRGVGRRVVALDPGGYWNRPERAFLVASLRASIAAARRLRPVLPLLAGNPVTRTLLLAQFSARPWAVPGDVVLRELRGLADAAGVDPALASLAAELPHPVVPAGAAPGRVVVGWGRWDRLTLPVQARRVLASFPGAGCIGSRTAGTSPSSTNPRRRCGWCSTRSRRRSTARRAGGAGVRRRETRRRGASSSGTSPGRRARRPGSECLGRAGRRASRGVRPRDARPGGPERQEQRLAQAAVVGGHRPGGAAFGEAEARDAGGDVGRLTVGCAPAPRRRHP